MKLPDWLYHIGSGCEVILPDGKKIVGPKTQGEKRDLRKKR